VPGRVDSIGKEAKTELGERICLRCDWTGGGKGRVCPRCQAPLYRVPQSRTPHELIRAPRQQPKPSGDRISSSPIETQVDESVPRAVAVAASRRWGVIVSGAFAVAAVWIVATGGPFARTEAPTASGPTVPPALRFTPAFPSVSERVGLTGLPPDGAVPSTPETGEVIARHHEFRTTAASSSILVGWVYVYADGRVIWSSVEGWMYERRLTSVGLSGVRSRAARPRVFLDMNETSQLPEGTWADRIRLYVPSRYAICYFGRRGPRLDASSTVGLFPAPVEALLRSKERTYDVTQGIAQDPAECSTVTTEDARSILEILRDRGGTGEVSGGWGYRFAPSETAWHDVSFTFHPLLPQGTWVE
jgi:hypothetical protein